MLPKIYFTEIHVTELPIPLILPIPPNLFIYNNLKENFSSATIEFGVVIFWPDLFYVKWLFYKMTIR